ncbi:hypothetical protein L1887_44512 [Cichorium endivia]|nr:hypothetical protein L1887_44512 [Cichorium endivia]
MVAQQITRCGVDVGCAVVAWSRKGWKVKRDEKRSRNSAMRLEPRRPRWSRASSRLQSRERRRAGVDGSSCGDSDEMLLFCLGERCKRKGESLRLSEDENELSQAICGQVGSDARRLQQVGEAKRQSRRQVAGVGADGLAERKSSLLQCTSPRSTSAGALRGVAWRGAACAELCFVTQSDPRDRKAQTRSVRPRGGGEGRRRPTENAPGRSRADSLIGTGRAISDLTGSEQPKIPISEFDD